MFYDAHGNIVPDTNVVVSAGQVRDIDEIDNRGRMPDFKKEDLLEKSVTVYGIVGPEELQYGAVYFVLLKREEDAPSDKPWGLMFPASSPVVFSTLRAARQKMLPFRGVLERVTSETNPDRQYWQWRRK